MIRIPPFSPLLLLFVAATAFQAYGQAPRQAPSNSNCSAQNSYPIGSPCVQVYTTTAEKAAQIIRENSNCRLLNLTQYYCLQPLRTNTGPTSRDFRPPPPPRPAPRAIAPPSGSYPIPKTPPPAGVQNAQLAESNQLWNRAVALLDEGRNREALRFLYKDALMGDRRAEATLGIRYQEGDAGSADDRAAAYWFGLAAAQGHRAAQYALGGMYLEGDGGLPKDQAKGTQLLIASATQGFDKAQLALGVAYEFGEGVPRDRAKAIALIQQSDLAPEISSVLANPRTPARFASEAAFTGYLNSLRMAQLAQAWAQTNQLRGGYNPGAIAEEFRRMRLANPPSPPAIPQY